MPVVHRLLLALLIPAILLQSIGAAWRWVDYMINTDAYAAKCMNKARPQLQCNGKCQLMLKIQQQEKQQQTTELEIMPRLQPLALQHSFYVYNFLVCSAVPHWQEAPMMATHLGYHSLAWHPPAV